MKCEEPINSSSEVGIRAGAERLSLAEEVGEIRRSERVLIGPSLGLLVEHCDQAITEEIDAILAHHRGRSGHDVLLSEPRVDPDHCIEDGANSSHHPQHSELPITSTTSWGGLGQCAASLPGSPQGVKLPNGGAGAAPGPAPQSST